MIQLIQTFTGNKLLKSWTQGNTLTGWTGGDDLMAIFYNPAWDTNFRIIAQTRAPCCKTRIYRSNDLITFTRGGVVFDNGDFYCFAKNVIWNGVEYVMSYNGPDGTQESVGIATSPDLLNWADKGYRIQPNVSPAPVGTVELFGSGLLYQGGIYYHMIDEGYDNTVNLSAALYTSADYLTWTRVGTMLTKGTGWEAAGISQGDLHYHQGKYIYYYHGSENLNPNADKRRVGIAYSSRVTGPYTKYSGNPVLTDSDTRNGAYIGAPKLYLDPLTGRWRLFYRASKDGAWYAREAIW